MNYDALLLLAIILLVGFVFGKLVDLIKIPEITGYIIAGVLIGPSVLNIISLEQLGSLKVIMSLVLAIIAYTIGTELWLPKLKKTGKSIVIITIFESLTTTVVVLTMMLLFGVELWLALTLSAIATATAPAAAMAIAKKLKAKGPLSDVALPVIGLDDIMGVLVFGLFSSLAFNLVSGTNETGFFKALAKPLTEVIVSVGVGSFFGLILGLLSKHLFNKMPKKERYLSYLSIVLSFILLILWASNYIGETYDIHMSTLLTPLMMGLVFTDMMNKETFDIQSAALHNFSGPFNILLFTMAGIELSLTVLLNSGFIAVLYIILRSLGKISGAYLGATVSRAPAVVRKNMGFTLLTQGGVEIGMVVAIVSMFPYEQGMIVQSIVLSGILVFELVGPILFKTTIVRVNEATALKEIIE